MIGLDLIFWSLRQFSGWLFRSFLLLNVFSHLWHLNFPVCINWWLLKDFQYLAQTRLNRLHKHKNNLDSTSSLFVFLNWIRTQIWYIIQVQHSTTEWSAVSFFYQKSSLLPRDLFNFGDLFSQNFGIWYVYFSHWAFQQNIFFSFLS